MENYLQRLRDEARKLSEAQQQFKIKSEEFDRERVRQSLEAEKDLSRRRQELEESLSQSQREFEESLKKELAAVRDQTERRRALAAAKRKAEILRESFRKRAHAEDSDPASRNRPGQGNAPDVFELEPRTRVSVASLNQAGTFLGMEGKLAAVEIGGKKVLLAPSDLRSVEETSAGSLRLPSNVTLRRAAADEVPHELNLVGKRVDEALPEVDKFLDQAALEGHASVRLIHGRGTGRLASAVRAYLQTHLHVAAARAGNEREGGDAVTIAELK